MCGVVGYAGFDGDKVMAAMADAIRHRGPDDSGAAMFERPAMGIAMRRLSIIDLAHGHQPFSACDGQVQLVYNGEIYNHHDLRQELTRLGHAFVTQCDTEVVLNAFLQWGDGAWDRLRGMFAVAVMDRRGGTNTLQVVRDRVGIKPLYWAEQDGALVFSSELKSLLAWPALDRTIDLVSVRNYLALRYVPGPRTLFQRVRKLPPGSRLIWRDGSVRIDSWWSWPRSHRPQAITPAAAIEQFGAVLADSVDRHAVADVPVGMFLSGGIDSCALAALMSRHHGGPLKAYTIRFPGLPGDESGRAAEVARHLGASHRIVDCTAQHFAGLPEIIRSLDEPIGDAIIVPTYELARAAAGDVKVVLSGVGGDEILGGYLFQRKLKRWSRLKAGLPAAVWPTAAALFRALPEPLLDRLFDYPGRLGQAGKRKLADFLAAFGHSRAQDDLRMLVSQFDPPDIDAVATPALAGIPTDLPDLGEAAPPGDGELAGLSAFLAPDWLPDLMCTQFDKLTMAHSIEGRVPYLDHVVIEAALALPDSVKLRGKTNKWVLREAARPFLPAEATDSRKAPFYLSFETYVRDPKVAALFDDALHPDRLRRRGLFRPDAVQALLGAGPETGFLGPKRAFAIAALEWWFDAFAPDARFA
ncbi:MAG: asparagine synthase (glutamine-hydrolyzing) [Alphaproteobacteria bacterium]|nr:asparagine synthase (glutamine-hydrolyzing) [Alphaproteobacteria bacterium]